MQADTVRRVIRHQGVDVVADDAAVEHGLRRAGLETSPFGDSPEGQLVSLEVIDVERGP